jgi:YHS domain-containing protein
MFVDVEVPVSQRGGLTVPVDAIVDSGTKKRVFVDRGNGVFEPREVETGWQSGDRVQIVKGLDLGERVVADGTFFLDSESKLKATTESRPMPTEGREQHDPAPLPDEGLQGAHGMSQIMLARTSTTARDPKCGMKLDPAKSIASGNTLEYRGTTYYFCSKECKETFRKDPDQYLATDHKVARNEEPHHDEVWEIRRRGNMFFASNTPLAKER